MCDDCDETELSDPVKQALDMMVKDHALVAYVAQEVGESVKIISSYASYTTAEIEKINQMMLEIKNDIQSLKNDFVGEVYVMTKKKND